MLYEFARVFIIPVGKIVVQIEEIMLPLVVMRWNGHIVAILVRQILVPLLLGQFAGLEELNQKYKDKGLVVIGFPCNQFKEQDPGTDGQIEEFCQLNYGVTFQIMKKTDVNGPSAHPIFEYLKTQAPTEDYKGLKAKAAKALFKTISKSVEKDSDIKWNFTKFLISKDGETIKRYAPTTEPKDFEQDVENMLA